MIKHHAFLAILCLSPLFGLEARIDSKYYIIESDLDANRTKLFASMMDAYHEYLKSTFHVKKDVKKLPLRIFGNKDEFNNYGKRINSNFRIGNYGFCMYGDNPELVVYFDGKYKGIFFHEGLHQFIEIIGKNLLDSPQWFNEGLAAYLEECDYVKGKIVLPKAANNGYYKVVNKMIESNSLVDISDFMKINLRDWNKDGSGNDYAIGATLIDFFLNNENDKVRQSFTDFIFAFKENNNYQKSFDLTYGKLNYSILNREFRKWVKNRG